MSKRALLVFSTMVLFTFASCAFKRVSRTKNIIYLDEDSTNNKAKQSLNVFGPRKHAGLLDVLIFIHGGTWNSGKKETYSFLGNRMARKNVITVVIDYPKSPLVTYNEMAKAAALSVKWVKQNIEQYGGDTNKIFISGHSAGGHLAALISVRNDYFDSVGITSPIKGTILIDAAGLDMYNYLTTENFTGDHTLLQTFTRDPFNWKMASPLYHLHKVMPPMLIYVGGKTYPFIKLSNEKLLADLKNLGYHPSYYLLKGKKHAPMIKQFLYSGSHRYKEITEFMRNEK